MIRLSNCEKLLNCHNRTRKTISKTEQHRDRKIIVLDFDFLGDRNNL